MRNQHGDFSSSFTVPKFSNPLTDSIFRRHMLLSESKAVMVSTVQNVPRCYIWAVTWTYNLL